MSREIKFRAWDLDAKEMIRPFTLLGMAGADKLFKRQLEAWNFMQYTGLKDKNGVEIYEGDIVYNSVSRARVEVSWQAEVNTVHWGTEVVKKEVTGWVPFCTGWANYIGSTGFEVIGNIYENPELLEEPNNASSGKED